MSVPLPLFAELDEPSDAELIAYVRSGDNDAYGLLYRRHAGSALALARQLTGSAAEADDLAAEAFAKVLVTLRAGGGPDTAFRAYLLTTLRNTLYDRARRERRVELYDDMTRHDPGVPWEDTAVAGLESSLAARAFNRLPERWQTVLWHTEVEQESPAQVAPLLGLTPNGVAALAYRAREGLRQAYLQEHLSDGIDIPHRATVNRLGAWARGGLSARQRAQVDGHLATCATCRALAAELEDVSGGMRSVVAPLVLGPGAAAYLAAHAGGGAGVGTGAGAATTAAALGGGAAGTAAAGTSAGGAVAGAAAAGSAVAGTAAGGAVGTAVAGTGSVIGTVTAWVAGTSAGQAVAATVAAVVIGGSAVVATQEIGSPGTAPPAAAARAGGVPGQGDRAPGAVPGLGGQPGTPGGGATASPGADPGSGRDPQATTGADQGDGTGIGAPGRGKASDQPTATADSSGTAGAPVPVAAQLVPGTPYPVGTLRLGSWGQVAVPVSNTGEGPASSVVATVQLPAGISLRADSGGGWQCTGYESTATCTLPALAAGTRSILRIFVAVAGDAELAGTLSGDVGSDGGAVTATIPHTVLAVWR